MQEVLVLCSETLVEMVLLKNCILVRKQVHSDCIYNLLTSDPVRGNSAVFGKSLLKHSKSFLFLSKMSMSTHEYFKSNCASNEMQGCH